MLPAPQFLSRDQVISAMNGERPSIAFEGRRGASCLPQPDPAHY